MIDAMGLLPTSITLVLLLVITRMFSSSWLPNTKAQSTTSATALDALLQDYAYRAFVRVRPLRTGIAYDGTVVLPSNLTGITISAMRLRSGSLRRRGVPAYKEFRIPVGVVVEPYVERLLLVYQNLGSNWSTAYYPLPGYTYVAPLLGLLAYDASNLSAKDLPELDMRASDQPISIKFSDVKLVPDGSSVVPKCVSFGWHGLPNFTNVVSGNMCSTFQQGHFSIVVESIAPTSPTPSGRGGNNKNNGNERWIIAGSVLGGGLGLLVLMGFLLLRCYRRKKLREMEDAADAGETLRMTCVGNTKVPSAMLTRTQPTTEPEPEPEGEYVHE